MYVLKKDGKIIHYRSTKEALERDIQFNALSGQIEESDFSESADGNNSIRCERYRRMCNEADPLKYEYEEALARETDNINELKQKWLSKKDEIRSELPYR